MAEFVMPKLGADMSAGKLLAWRKNVGDRIERGEIIADIETDKADIEVEVFTGGVIEKIIVQPGESVPTGTVLALIREDREPQKAATITSAEVIPSSHSIDEAARPQPVVQPESQRLRSSPAARKLAEALGINLALVKGTGPAGRITREDVEQAAKQKPLRSVSTDRKTKMRQTIAAAMTRSKREIPHYYLSTTIDMHNAMEWLARENQKRSVEDRLLYGVLLIKAVALALREVPELNSTWIEDKVVESSQVHVGVAISLRGGGLVAPALHNTDRQSLDELMKNFRDLVNRARIGSLKGSELADSTITVTSLGEKGVETVFGIIYPPQVALVGFGKVVERPWSIDGQIVSRPLVNVTLSADHRVSDGHRGGLFLTAIDKLLQEPGNL